MMEGGSEKDFEDLDNYSINQNPPKAVASPLQAKNKINEAPKFTESFQSLDLILSDCDQDYPKGKGDSSLFKINRPTYS
jgi:hypothetical protein